MGLLITPSGMRLPFSVSYYTEAYCKAKKIAYRKQTELAAQLIRQLPLPPEAHVVVLGDTAFDAKAIRTACEERKFSWIVPINPERVLAGEKPRPKVSSLSEDLTADQMVCLKVHPGKGKYVDYRRISRYRIGPKFRPPDLRIAWVDGRWAYVLPELGFGRSLSERTRMRGGKWKWYLS